MKMKKFLLGALAIVLIVALTIAGTVAFLTTEKQTKKNVFSVGDVEILLDEKVGVIGGGEVSESKDGATYTEIMPGDYIQKEVSVENTGDSDAYVKVTVTMNNANRINQAIDVYYEGLGYSADAVQAMYDYIFDGWNINYNPRPGKNGTNNARGVIETQNDTILKVDFVKTTDYSNDTVMFDNTNWFMSEKEEALAAQGKYSGFSPASQGYYTSQLKDKDDPATDKDERDYVIVYTYYIKLNAEESITLFNGLNVPEEFNAAQLSMFDGLEINVEASAIQADNFDTAKEAFEALAEIEGGNKLVGEPEMIWDGETATYEWFENPVAVADTKVSGNVYVLESASDFAGFANMVNGTAEEYASYGAISFKGATVKLGTDIYLNGHEWTPIGNSTNKFQGTFDGQDHTISDLVITGNKSDVGLFGFTTEGEIRKLTVKNAKVSGYLNVGVVAGTPYTSKYTYITVTGHVEVNGFAYVGGVGGKNAYANWDNITVDADETSYVKAISTENGSAYRTYVGGVVGFNGEGGHKFSNITSNIDVIGDVCDIGGIFGIAHYNNEFENITCTGDVTNLISSENDGDDAVIDVLETGLIAGVWHNQNGTTVSFTNISATGNITAPNVENVTFANNGLIGKAYSATGTGKLIINGGNAVDSADTLIENLENGNDVTLIEDVKIDPAGMSNAYGKTGINVKNGQTIDGNGNTLDIQGAGGTWDSGINTTGGLIKNITITGSFRGIFINHNSEYSEPVVLENVTIDGTVYTISCDQGMNQTLKATNSTFKGWTSYAATLGSAEFIDCDFGEGSGYAYCRPFAPTAFVGCDFEAGFQLDAIAAVTFEDCTIGGEPLTAENLSTLVTSNIANATVVE